MLKPEFIRLLALAQLVTPEVVGRGREDDIEGVTEYYCDKTLKHFGGSPLTPEEVRDVVEIVRSMLAARYWANRAGPTRKGLTIFDALAADRLSPASPQSPANRGA